MNRRVVPAAVLASAFVTLLALAGPGGAAAARPPGPEGRPAGPSWDDMVTGRTSAADPLAPTRRAARESRASGTPTVHHVYVSILKVTDDTGDDDWSLEDLSEANVATAIQRISDYWSAESDGAVTFEIAGYETRSLGQDGCDWTAAYDAGEQVAFDGAALGADWVAAHNHLLMLSQENAACHTGGHASVGGGTVFLPNGLTDENVEYPGLPGLVHEFGHNLGFGHADSGICRDAVKVDAPLGQFRRDDLDSQCPYKEYGDTQDIMGFSLDRAYPHLSAISRARAGWLAGSLAAPGVGTTTVVLHPLDDATGLRAARITDPRTGQVYVVEYRTKAGADATSIEYRGAARQEGGLFYLFPPRVGGNGDSFARWTQDTPEATGGVRISRLLTFPPGDPRYNAYVPSYSETVTLAVGTSTSSPNVYNRNDHLDAGESFTSYSGGIKVEALALDAVNGAQVRFIVARAPSATTLKVADVTLTTSQRPRLTAVVSAPAATTVTGKVTVLIDRRVRYTVSLGAGGRATFNLPAFGRAGRGKHVLSLSYVGSSQALPSASRSVTVKVG
ncbi:Ig-like domain repeat protein [Nocardioides rubriscoriae]|uniref:Ig-like domain repeat protein n=1 Tax=Nocardioides rubriscoriae TaxID=642762 RepID=UPI0011E05040|nr:Ig-like domain repeat protein [Nocardioides rubriscoriae]